MFRKSTQIKALATTAAAIALAVPATASANVDLRNPDNRVSEPQAQAQVDLRNPDSREPSQPASKPSSQVSSHTLGHQSPPAADGYVDLRSPDSREAGRPAEALTVATQTHDTADFSWGDAAIGAGVAFGLLMIALSGMIAVSRRRGHGATA